MLTQPGESDTFTWELDLTPSSFSTGSFGWKGGEKILVHVPDADGEMSGVHVMLTWVNRCSGGLI